MADTKEKEVFPEALIPAEKAKREAEAVRALSEAAKYDAETRKAVAEAEQAEYVTELSKFEHTKATHLERKRLAADEFHHLYRFMGVVNESSVKQCMAQLSSWRRLDEGVDIEIAFSSPGGSIIDGFVLWDYIQELKDAQHKVVTSTLGMAASMAGVLLQAGDVRIMGKQSWLLIHEASFGAGGSMGQVEDTVEWAKAMQERILDIFADRSSMTKTAIKRKWARKDWWINADESLKLGFVDQIR